MLEWIKREASEAYGHWAAIALGARKMNGDLAVRPGWVDIEDGAQ
jgi:hypothetical protein